MTDPIRSALEAARKMLDGFSFSKEVVAQIDAALASDAPNSCSADDPRYGTPAPGTAEELSA